MSGSTDTLADQVRTVDLQVTGMTCAACANRIERKLNKLDGVEASVNYATEKAHVVYPAGLAPDVLLETVAAAGYSAAVPRPASEVDDGPDETAALRVRLVAAAVLSVPVIAMAMVPALQVYAWQW